MEEILHVVKINLDNTWVMFWFGDPMGNLRQVSDALILVGHASDVVSDRNLSSSLTVMFWNALPTFWQTGMCQLKIE